MLEPNAVSGTAAITKKRVTRKRAGDEKLRVDKKAAG